MPSPSLQRFAFLFLSFSSLMGCGDDTSGPLDADVGSDAGAMMLEGGQDAAGDAATRPDATPDAEVPSSRHHESFIPPGLAPETATRLVVLGDSISDGVGASRSAWIYHALLAENDDEAYPTEAGTDLESLTGASVEVVDVSRGGARARDLSAQTGAVRRELSLPASGHTVVVLTIGGNDLQTAVAGGNPTGALLDNAIRDIRGMIEFFQDTDNFSDGASIYLANVYDPSDGEAQIPGCFFGLHLPQLVAALDVWSERFMDLGMEMGFSVVDTLGAFHGHGHHNSNTMNPYYDADDPTKWFDDCIHPNDRGHHELRRLIYEAMSPTYRAE